MNTSSLLSRSCLRKGFFRFVAPFLFCAIALVGALGITTAYADSSTVDLQLHNDDSGQVRYARLDYMGLNDTTPQETGCITVPALAWQDLNVQAVVGQQMWLNYYRDSSCDASSQIYNISIPPSATSSASGTCWFNPDNTTTPNWSGCVNPSQTLPIHYGLWTNVDLMVHNDTSGQVRYARLDYMGLNNTTPQETGCITVQPLAWQDLNVRAVVRQQMWLNYYRDSSCGASSQIYNISIPPSATSLTAYPVCWFNPDNTTTPNWSGCIDPSQILPIHYGPAFFPGNQPICCKKLNTIKAPN